MKRSILSVALASVLVLSGCGTSEDDEAKDSISTYLMKQQASGQMVALKQGEADCISDGMVEGVGVDQLKEYGFLNDDGTVNEKAETPKMSKDDSTSMVDSMFRCTDVMKTIKTQLGKSMGEQPPAVKECFDENLTEDAVRAMLVATFQGDQDKAGQALLGPLMQCTSAGSQAPSN
jgi:hypothetical protein